MSACLRPAVPDHASEALRIVGIDGQYEIVVLDYDVVEDLESMIAARTATGRTSCIVVSDDATPAQRNALIVAGACAVLRRTDTAELTAVIERERAHARRFAAEAKARAQANDDRERNELVQLQEKKLRLLSEAAFDGILVHDYDEVLEVNHALSVMFGYSPKEMIGMQLLSLIHPDSRHTVRRAMTARRARYDCTAVRKDGTPFEIEISCADVPDEDGALRVVAFRDISLRKQWETALAESEESFRAICQAAFDGFMVHENGRISVVNEQCAAMFGCTPEEMVGRGILEFTAPQLHDKVLELVRTRSETPFESVGVRADGTRFPLELCGITKRGSDVRIVALRDVSEKARANEELRRREERFRVLSHVAFDGILLERDGVVDEANEAFAEMFGYATTDLAGRSVDSLIDMIPEREGRFQGTGVRSNGTTFPVAICVATADDGQRVYAIRDVTREKLAREQLSESERRYRELSESTHDLLCLHDLEGNILEVNSAALRAIGYSYEELDGASLRTFLAPNTLVAFEQYLDTIAHEGTAEGHMAVITKSGERRLWHFRNVLQTSGNRAYIRGLARDVTEQEKAALALQKSEQHYRSIIENISDTITILDHEGTIQYQSPSVERVLGYTTPESHTSYEDFIHPDDLPAAREFFNAQLNNPGAKGTLDARVRHRDGSWRWLSMVATSHRTDQAVSLIVNGRDVTERRLLLSQLEQAKRVNSLGHLAATVAHEFNNVLMGMQPFAELMQRPSVSPQNIAKAAGYIISSIARGKRVALDILRFTQPATPSFAAVDLARWWDRLVPEMQASTGNSIAFQWSVPSDLGVTADATQLAQVLSNLVSNARDAMPQGGKLNVVARRPVAGETFSFGIVDQPENFVQLSVSDTGAGIPEEVIAHIFEPLFTTKRNGGTGLGLAVVHQVMARHGGSIFVESQVGVGTTFHVFIPAATAAPRVAEAQPREAQRLGNIKILIVDDEPGIVDGVAELLQNDGATTRTAGSGAELLETAQVFAADVAVVDINLPDGDGFEFGEKLRARRPDLCVVYVSGHADSRRVPESASHVAFLQKPFPISRLVDEIVRRGWGAQRQ